MMPNAESSLAGRRVLLTRSPDGCAEWAAELERRGARPVLLPCIESEPLDSPELRAALAAATARADWLVLTSRRGVEAFAALYRRAPPARCRIAVVGAATEAAACNLLGRADLVGRGGTAAGLAATLVVDGELDLRPEVLIAVAANAGDALERALTAAGARCTRLDVYRTVPAAAAANKRALSSLGADNVVLASPSAATGFVRQVEIDSNVAIYTIGPSTSKAARALGLDVTAEAREPSLEGLVEAMQWRN
jgi:uroporphyrinogen-III synthase